MQSLWHAGHSWFPREIFLGQAQVEGLTNLLKNQFNKHSKLVMDGFIVSDGKMMAKNRSFTQIEFRCKME